MSIKARLVLRRWLLVRLSLVASALRNITRSAERLVMPLAALVTLSSTPLALAAASQDPAPDTVVETQLAPRAVKQQIRAQLSALEQARHEGNATAASPPAQRIARAREMISASRASGDPRLLGYAQAQLEDLDEIDALVLRATVEQSLHQFDRARALLDRAINQSPNDAQARLTRATVALVQGQYRAARADCDRLGGAAGAICSACVDADTGANGAALAALERIARSEPQWSGWALSLAGDVRMQDGRATDALRDYATALAQQGDDLYTRVALADALLELGRNDRVLALLATAPPTDAVLLRRWQAARRSSGEPSVQNQVANQVAQLTAQLEARIAADAARAGDSGRPLHAREAALFELERGHTAAALNLARANWAAQREPADARLLAAAARASGETALLAELRAWVQDSGLRDVRLERALDGAAS